MFTFGATTAVVKKKKKTIGNITARAVILLFVLCSIPRIPVPNSRFCNAVKGMGERTSRQRKRTTERQREIATKIK